MITNQAYLFLIFIANGILIGVIFDFFRILRKSFKTADIITYIEDILFWILTGAIILYSIFVFSNGEIRFFMFIGILIGTIIYMLVASKYIIKVNVSIITFTKKVIKRIIKIIYIPLKITLKLIRKIFIKPISFITINLQKISTKASKKLHNNLKNIKISKNNSKKLKIKKEF